MVAGSELTTQQKKVGSFIKADRSLSGVTNKDDVDSYGPHRNYMEYYFNMHNALEGGVQTMREAGQTYLPKFPGENQDSYDYRLGNSWLFNFYERIGDTFSGLIFNEEVNVDSDLPKEIIDDVDQLRYGVHEFLEDCNHTAMSKGFCIGLVDTPPLELDTDGSIIELTKEEERKNNIRPSWVKIEPENVIDIHVERINNVEYITHLRWKELEQIQEGIWGTKEREIIKVIRRDTNEEGEPTGRLVFEKYAKSDDGKEFVLKGDTLPYAMPFITATVFYSTKPKAPLCARPLLAKIAEKNIEYWQTASDQRSILTVSRFSILHLHKVKAKPSSLGPFMSISTEEEGATVKWVPNENAGIGYGEKDKDRIIQEAEALSIELMVKPKETATKTKTNSMQNMSALQRTAKFAEVAGNMLLYFTALWLGQKEGGTVKVNKDLGLTLDESIVLDDLNIMYANESIDQPQYLAEKKALGVLSEVFKIEVALDSTKGSMTI